MTDDDDVALVQLAALHLRADLTAPVGPPLVLDVPIPAVADLAFV